MGDTAKRRAGNLRPKGSLENKLDVAAWGFLIVNLLLAFLLVLSREEEAYGLALFLVVTAVLSWLLFRSLAEIIRLLKVQAGLHYDGKISGIQARVTWVCSECGTTLGNRHRCPRCGRMIVGTEEEFAHA
jgi:hypothetical protein